MIDEAYGLHSGAASGAGGGSQVNQSVSPYSAEVITVLVEQIQSGDDRAVFMMGYEREMAALLDANPGLKSRFPSSFKFEDYDDNELSRILQLLLKELKVKCGAEALNAAITVLAKKRNAGNFGNARAASNLVKDVLAKYPTATELLAEMFESQEPKGLSIDDLKKQLVPHGHRLVREFIERIEAEIKLKIALNQNPLDDAKLLNFLFVGPPGTVLLIFVAQLLSLSKTHSAGAVSAPYLSLGLTFGIRDG